MLESIYGQIERITFANEENNFAVIKVKVPKRKNLLTAIGIIAEPTVGEFIEMEGSFEKHAKFGLRFKFNSYTTSVPDTVKGLAKYLGSGLIKGVGPVLAERMVERFGHKVLDVLEDEPEKLSEVEGLGAKRREMIIESWQSTRNFKRFLTFLAQFNLGPKIATRIIKKLGENAEEKILANPYCLAYEVDGIGFVTADKVAATLGLPPNSPERLKAAILYTLNQESLNGHVYFPALELLSLVKKLLPEAENKTLNEALGEAILQGQIKPEKQKGPEDIDLFLPKLQNAENWIAISLKNLLLSPQKVKVPRIENAVAWAEKELGLTLSEDQKKACETAFKSKVLIITGGPGTGKTTICQVITKVFKILKAKVLLAAPTGRAAKRLSEATGLEAKTIHRLLEFAPGGFLKGPKNKLDVDVLLVDELSMVDVYLMNQILGALPNKAILIMVGDQDQLPSIGPGKILSDLIASNVLPKVILKEIYRQSQNSDIVKAAYNINCGIIPQSSADAHGDFYFMKEEDPEILKSKILKMITGRLPEKFSLNPVEDIQVLTPFHKGETGTEALNNLLSEKLNPQKGKALTHFGRNFKYNDKVMQLKNNYDKDIYNGDFGYIKAIDFIGQNLKIDFEGQLVDYEFKDLDELSLAYAITIHKSQGSEFPVVIIPILKEHYIMLKRNLLYTAVTRGKKFVVLIGSDYALKKAVETFDDSQRYTKLAEKLKEVLLRS